MVWKYKANLSKNFKALTDSSFEEYYVKSILLLHCYLIIIFQYIYTWVYHSIYECKIFINFYVFITYIFIDLQFIL